ncbi:MAG: tetratricopeptide repeat protein, partial [Anaerolineae bacterium]
MISFKRTWVTSVPSSKPSVRCSDRFDLPPDHLSDVDLLIDAGIDAARAGDHERARDLLTLAVSWDGTNVRAWLWLSSEVEGNAAKAFCLRRVLAVDPGNQAAWRGLDWLHEQARHEAEAPRLDALRQAAADGAVPSAAPPPTLETAPAFSQETIGGTRQPLAETIVDKRPSERAPQPRPQPAERAGLGLRNEFTLIAALGLAALPALAALADTSVVNL